MAIERQEPIAQGVVSAVRHAAGPAIVRALAAMHAPPPALRRPAVVARARLHLAAALEREAERGTGFVAFAALMIAGAAIHFSLPFEPSPILPLALLGAALAALAATGATGGRRGLLAAAVALALGMAAGALETRRAATTMLGGEISTRLTARVAAIEDRARGRVRLTLDVMVTQRPVLRHAPGRLRATARALPEGLRIGSVVEGVVRLLPATGPARPQGYDFAFEAYHAGIGSSGFFLRGPYLAAGQDDAGLLRRAGEAVEAFRLDLTDHIRGRIGGPEGEIAAALVTGVRGGIAEADNEALRRTGLAHFISISGLHMALVAATVLVGVRTLFATMPLLSSRRPVKKYAAAAALLATSAYLLISGQEVAAQRSYLMCAVMLVAVLFDRAALTMRNLAISAVVVVALAPHEVMGPSFQMSFAATAALIAAYAWHTERRRFAGGSPAADRGGAAGIARRALLFAGGLAATSAIAGLATTIFGVWHFQRVSPLGLFANLAAMPIVTFAVMPSAVAGVLLTPLGLDGPFFAVMGWGLRVVMDVARWLSERSPVDAVGAIPAASVVLLALALAAATIATTAFFRAVSLPLLAAGLVLVPGRELPDILVAEDGRLVAVRMADGSLAVNRARPSSFTIGNWTNALAAAGTVRPRMLREGESAPFLHVASAPEDAGRSAESGDAPADAGRLAESSNPPADMPGERPFSCRAGLCVARHAGGAVIAHAQDAAAARSACGAAALLVVGDATARDVCARTDTVVVTGRDLARRGSLAVHLANGVPELHYAIAEEPRVWHRQRRFSREARGLAPYRREAAQQQQPATADGAGEAQPGD